MNNIHEKDWAEEGWSGHTGMDSFADHSLVENKIDQATDETQTADQSPPREPE